MGGVGGKWYFDSKVRDFGCSIVALISLYLIGIHGQWWMYFLSLGTMFGSLTTYHKWMNPIFGDDKEDVRWYGWFMHGFCFGLALFWFYTYLPLILKRAFVLGIFTAIWCEGISKDWLEEGGRGFLFNMSLLIFL